MNPRDCYDPYYGTDSEDEDGGESGSVTSIIMCPAGEAHEGPGQRNNFSDDSWTAKVSSTSKRSRKLLLVGSIVKVTYL
jgi:hypothetical protein